jgi:predicted exporter
MSAARIRLLFLAAVLGMGAYCATRLELSTNITNFMPADGRAELAVLASQLADSELTRTMILTLGARDIDVAVAAAGELARAMRVHPQVATVRTGMDPGQMEELYRLYFPSRLRFLSDRPEQEIPQLVSPEALRARARTLRDQLSLPSATLLKRVIAEDPLGAFERILQGLRAHGPLLRIRDGQFVSRDGRFAVLFLASKASAFESRAQAQLLDDLRRSFAEIAQRRGGGLVLEEAGANRFAVATERRMRRDVALISAVAFVGVAVVFLAFLRSLHFFVLAVIPPLTGILTAATATHLVFGRVDGLTLAFGASLIGVAIDYSIHVIDHHRLDPETPPEALVRRLRPALCLGALTTMASFAGLVLTSFPGFREIGFFAMTGVGASLVVTLVVLPGLLHRRGGAPVPALASRVAKDLGDVVRAWVGNRRALAALPLACAVASLFLWPRLHFVDDLSRLMALDPALRAEEDRVRERVAGVDQGRVVVALGADPEAAVALNDRVAERMEAARSQGVLADFRSLHAFLRSRELQERNLRALDSIPDLADRVEDAFAAEGFRREALAPFRESLDGPAPPVIDAAALRASPLEGLLAPLLLDLGDRFAALTHLRGVASPEGLDAALAGLESVHVFDQRSFLNEIYREFRITTLEQTGVGTVLVVLVLGAYYRRWRPVLVALVPSLLVVVALLCIFAASGVETNLLHVVSLNIVMGMGVDFGVYMVESDGGGRRFDATMLSLLLCCLTTVFAFGTLAISAHPALRAIGVTMGLGTLLSFAFAPVCFVLLDGTLDERGE